MSSNASAHTTVGHAIGRCLLRHGVSLFFGQAFPQGLSMAFEDLGLRQIFYRTENAGGCMADGYARVAHKPGVMIAQNGPAATLTVAPLAEALKSSIPLVVFIQEIPLANEDKNAFQEYDHVRLFSACSKWTRRLTTAERAEDYVDQAFMNACSGRPGPAVLIIPNDILGQPAAPSTRTENLGRYPLDPSVADPARIADLARALAEAENPLIIAGGGVHGSGACYELAALQETFSLPVATTVMGKGAVDEGHPLSLGVMANVMGPAAMSRHLRGCMERADLVLLVGTRTSQNGTDSWKLYPKNARFAHIDVDGGEVGRNYEALRLVGDARLTLQALHMALSAMDTSRRAAARAALEAEIAQSRARFREELAPLAESEATPLRPERIMAALAKRLTPDSIVAADASFASLWATNNLPCLRAGMRFVTPRGLAGLGWGMPLAMGAALAAPGAPVWCITGDGGFGHVWAEMETAVRSRIPLTVILLNNGVLGYCLHSERLRYGRNSSAITFGPVDHAAIARACGMHGVRVHTPAELEAALDGAGAAPLLIEVMTDDDCPPITDFVGP